MNIKKQKGYINVPGKGFWLFVLLLAAVGGWAVIGGIIWLLQHIRLEWVG